MLHRVVLLTRTRIQSKAIVPVNALTAVRYFGKANTGRNKKARRGPQTHLYQRGNNNNERKHIVRKITDEVSIPDHLKPDIAHSVEAMENLTQQTNVTFPEILVAFGYFNSFWLSRLAPHVVIDELPSSLRESFPLLIEQLQAKLDMLAANDNVEAIQDFCGIEKSPLQLLADMCFQLGRLAHVFRLYNMDMTSINRSLLRATAVHLCPAHNAWVKVVLVLQEHNFDPTTMIFEDLELIASYNNPDFISYALNASSETAEQREMLMRDVYESHAIYNQQLPTHPATSQSLKNIAVALKFHLRTFSSKTTTTNLPIQESPIWDLAQAVSEAMTLELDRWNAADVCFMIQSLNIIAYPLSEDLMMQIIRYIEQNGADLSARHVYAIVKTCSDIFTKTVRHGSRYSDTMDAEDLKRREQLTDTQIRLVMERCSALMALHLQNLSLQEIPLALEALITLQCDSISFWQSATQLLHKRMFKMNDSLLISALLSLGKAGRLLQMQTSLAPGMMAEALQRMRISGSKFMTDAILLKNLIIALRAHHALTVEVLDEIYEIIQTRGNILAKLPNDGFHALLIAMGSFEDTPAYHPVVNDIASIITARIEAMRAGEFVDAKIRIYFSTINALLPSFGIILACDTERTVIPTQDRENIMKCMSLCREEMMPTVLKLVTAGREEGFAVLSKDKRMRTYITETIRSVVEQVPGNAENMQLVNALFTAFHALSPDEHSTLNFLEIVGIMHIARNVCLESLNSDNDDMSLDKVVNILAPHISSSSSSSESSSNLLSICYMRLESTLHALEKTTDSFTPDNNEVVDPSDDGDTPDDDKKRISDVNVFHSGQELRNLRTLSELVSKYTSAFTHVLTCDDVNTLTSEQIEFFQTHAVYGMKLAMHLSKIVLHYLNIRVFVKDSELLYTKKDFVDMYRFLLPISEVGQMQNYVRMDGSTISPNIWATLAPMNMVDADDDSLRDDMNAFVERMNDIRRAIEVFKQEQHDEDLTLIDSMFN